MTPRYPRESYVFHYQRNGNEHDEHITHLLHTTLRFTVEELPFLAGSVVPLSKNQPWLHDVRSYRAAYFKIKDLFNKMNFIDFRR